MQSISKSNEKNSKPINPKVFIILLNYNGWEDTIECLESLLAIDYENYQVIIVDNKSTDNSVDEIKRWAKDIYIKKVDFKEIEQKYKNLTYIEYSKETAEKGGNEKSEKYLESLKSNEKFVLIKSDENYGFAGGNNIGIRYALNCGADYIMLLNNDTVVTTSFLKPLIESINTVDNAGIASGKIYDYYNRDKYIAGGYIDLIKGSGYHYYNKNSSCIENVSFLSGCLWLIKREVFEEVGLLDENFFLYVEDVEFCYRVVRSGKKLLYNPNSVIYHKESKSTGKKSPLVIYYNTRNRLYFVNKCYESFYRKVIFYLFFFTTRIIKMLTKKNYRKHIIKGFLDYRRRNFGKSNDI